ncbi:MAG: glycosyltransferase family 2 protein [Bacteroidales bacterium]|nr:glycosyltransferase family 2 protein [Bacteroidales bacterium]
MNISVVIPLYNEVESIGELCQWISRVMQQNKFTYEVLLIDDGSRDGSWDEVKRLSKENESIKGVRFQRNYGKSAALSQGFLLAQGEVVITMDADLQDSPDEIPELYKKVTNEGFDIVSGWKKKRHDPFIKRRTSKFFNWATRRVSRIKLHDFNCGLKAYKNEVIKAIEVYGEMHRYMPVMAKWAGFTNIGEQVVKHYPRKYGKTKFGLERFINGFLDLLSITFVSKFGKRPMHFFGLWGTLLFMIGFAIAGFLAYEKIFHEVYKMTERPLFYLGLLAMMMGSQLFLAGFIGELISRNSAHKHDYIVADKSGIISINDTP